MPTPGIGLSWSVASSSVIEPDLIQASTFPQPAQCLSPVPAGPIFSFTCWGPDWLKPITMVPFLLPVRPGHVTQFWPMRYKEKVYLECFRRFLILQRDISYASGYCAWNRSNHLLTSPRLTTAPRIARQKAGKNLGPW